MRFSLLSRIAGSLLPAVLVVCVTWGGSARAAIGRDTSLFAESDPELPAFARPPPAGQTDVTELGPDTSIDRASWDSPNCNDGLFGESPRSVPSLADLTPVCDPDPQHSLGVFVGYDTWRAIPDGDWQNNGIHTGVNFGTRLGLLSDWTGIGAQVGGSVGAYNWSGTDYRIARNNVAEVQGFLTYGFFRRANEASRVTAALVQDWMFNSNFSVFAQNPTFAQWRAQLGYAFNSSDELGLWGAWRLRQDSRIVPGFGNVTWRPLDQISLYWHHKWGVGDPDTWLWLGLPEQGRLSGNGTLGDYYVGLLANCPFNDVVSLYAQVTYMHPSASPGPVAAREDQWSFSIGLTIYPQRIARTPTVAGRCWTPQMPVANNGTFLMDASQTY